MNQERLARLQALQSQVRTGGKGTVRRKKKSARHGAALDEKKLQMTMKKMNMTPLPGIDTVNMFREDEKVLHFRSPKVGAAPTGSTLSVTGVPEIRDLKDMMPDIIAEMGIPRNLLEMLAKQRAGKAEGGADADDDVPELIEDFEAQARRPEAAAGV